MLIAVREKPGLLVLLPNLILAALLALIAGCGGLVYHRVERGDTLYSISWRYNQDFRDVAAWNKLQPPYVIHSGDWVRVAPPVEGIPVRARTDRPQTKPSRAAPVVIVDSGSEPKARTNQKPPDAASTPSPNSYQWNWPTTGALLRTFSGADSANKGLDIGGRIGQPVRAAAPGRVVYAGNGLLNYGNLIIIKHDDELLSAYGYNQVMRVAENDMVSGGQHIADMGMKTDERPMLHFEIRFDGKPVDPLRYLGPMPRM